jgi:hypothetical protein
MNEPDDVPLVDGLEIPGRDAFDPPAIPPRLRESILAATTLRVRARRTRRRLLVAAAALILYGAGAVSGGLLRSAAPEDGSPGARATSPAGPAAAVLSLPADPAEIDARVAAAPPAERSRVLREAGDATLASGSDPVAAARYYRRSLDATDDASSAVPGPGDSWLLTYLKLSRN